MERQEIQMNSCKRKKLAVNKEKIQDFTDNYSVMELLMYEKINAIKKILNYNNIDILLKIMYYI